MAWDELARAVWPRVEDPLRALELVVETRATLDRLERMFVEDARRSRASWDEIGAALAISRQAAHRRHRGFVSR